MTTPILETSWFFVDESGDPTFYDRNGNLIVGQGGCSSILILGFIETQAPDVLRSAVLTLQREVVRDPYLSDIPSLRKTAVAFHAKDDLPEVRYRFFKLLSTLEFSAQFVVARKIEKVFRNTFEAKQDLFYDHLVSHLFREALHPDRHNFIYFSKRGSRTRQRPFVNAIEGGLAEKSGEEARARMPFTAQAQTPEGEPCLSVIDYMNWAVYRAFIRGEMRYLSSVEDKVELIVDLYDYANYPQNRYMRGDLTEIKKATPI